jgi:hypothetical protein
MNQIQCDESPRDDGKQRDPACDLPSQPHSFTYPCILRRFAAKSIRRQSGLYPDPAIRPKS